MVWLASYFNLLKGKIKMEQVTLIQITPENLQVMLGRAVSDAIEAIRPKEKKFLTRQQVAAFFSVTLPTVHEWINDGKLKAYKIGGRTLFDASEIETAAIVKQVFRYKHGRA